MSSWWFDAMILIFIVVPVIILVGYAVWDVIRRHDFGVAHRAVWLIVFCLFPIVGALVYLVIRPPGTTAQEEAFASDATSAATELTKLADLHDRGKLSDEEFSHLKAQIYVPDSVAAPDREAHRVPASVREGRGGQV